MHKSRHKKLKRPKKRVTQTLIAEVVDCSVGMVNDVLKGRRNNDTDLGTRIELADILLEEKVEQAIIDVKKVVKKP